MVALKKIPLFLLFVSAAFGCAVKLDKQVTVPEVDRILRTLSSDDMQGRRTFTAGIDKAADFIANEFEKIGLQQLPGVQGYKQTFNMVRATASNVNARINGQQLDPKHVIIFASEPQFRINNSSGYTKSYIAAGSNLGAEVTKLNTPTTSTIVFVDTSFSSRFSRLANLRSYSFPSNFPLVFVLAPGEVTDFSIEATMDVKQYAAQNVVGVLPGRTKANEQVIFSGHYDHLGIGRAVDGDSIYNGANDDASGITGVIMAAKYFKKQNTNARTLVFAAFTAEEMGGFGSKYFSQQLDAEKVVAMFNLEMIGTDSKWGKNSAYITGFDETDMGKILQKNLQGSGFTFHADPYPQQQLFYRSDNATLARLGVPAHTISTSKMDVEPNYHKPSDEIGTLDLANMTAIIQAIIKSSASIVNGTDAPTRVNAANLRGRQ